MKLGDQRTFQHTSIAAYLLATAALGCLFYDSTKGILQRYELNKKWYYLWGITCFFAYLYIRPLIRRGIGSASSGYINFSSVYIGWLCGAVFLHLPSLKSLGLDVRTDVSVLLTLFLLSLLALMTLHGLHGLAVFCKLLSPALYNPLTGYQDWLSIILLNSFNLAIACSTYYGFCGNAGSQQQEAGAGTDVKAQVCNKWLHPIDMRGHPAFASWVIYGDTAAADGADARLVHIDLPLDGRGPFAIPASDTISPILSMWLTLVFMYIANSLADYWAASCLQSADARRVSPRRGPTRRRSAEYTRPAAPAKPQKVLRRSSSLTETDTASLTELVRHMSRGVSQSLQGGLLSLAGSQSQLPGLGRVKVRPGGKAAAEAAASDRIEEQPDFLPMVPWYSGTSADMYKTVFDLLISVKLFLGRFDMRTMQAATAAVPPGVGADAPQAGDGFTYEHLADRDSLWLDFMADCGDGGDPTYTVAAAMASPMLHVTVPEGLDLGQAALPDTSSSSSSGSSGLDSPPTRARRKRKPTNAAPRPGACILPRGDALVIGGDLAYPNPSTETYETRFFRPYEAAMPAPAHAVPGALVLQKPDLPLDGCSGCRAPPTSACAVHSEQGQRHLAAGACRTCQATAALNQYEGPSCFAIPGNHDWIDGLETFQRHIQHRGWLGGWLLPQEASYFALKLPQGWWLFGLDLALLDDIDMCQCRYFARIADERMGPNDAAILVTHQPRWLMDWFWEEAACHNLRQLVRAHLRGRARVHLAGDLHFYMRHSFQPAPAAESPSASDAAASDEAAKMPFAPGRSPPAAEAYTAARSAFADLAAAKGLERPGSPPWHDMKSQNGHGPANGHANGHASQYAPSPPASYASADEIQEAAALYEELATAASRATLGIPRKRSQAEHPQLAETLDTQSLPALAQPVVRCKPVVADPKHGHAVATGIGSPEEDSFGARANHHPHDPEHLIVQGMGGAFLHPTHVFASARFGSIPEPPPDYGLLRGSSPRYPNSANATMRGISPVRGTSPSGRHLKRQGSAIGELGVGKLEDGGAGVPGGGGEFCCKAAYPSPQTSLLLGRLNLHVFRMQNTRFDIIGGALYFLLVVSVMPQCGHVAAVLEATSLPAACLAFAQATAHAAGAIFTQAYLSLGALAFLFVMTFGFAKGGGAGAIPSGTLPPGSPDGFWLGLALRGRSGGLPTQLMFAAVHTGMHLLAALVLMVLLELGVETCIKYESLGQEGYHSLFKWYQRFEAEAFPDPQDLRGACSRWTGGLYPGVLQAAFALFDVPEAIAVSRSALCQGVTSLTRLQAGAYYVGMLAYYWVLATPTIGFLFGCYLYVCVNWFHLHYDEAFSSLRIPHYKGFSRLHITPEGTLHVYSLGMDQVPSEWREDSRWRRRKGAGSRRMASHAAEVPSRWAPVHGKGRSMKDPLAPTDPGVKLVDFVAIPKRSSYASRRPRDCR